MTTTETPMWHFTTDTGTTHAADSTSDALSAVIDGYGDGLDRDEAFFARLDHARELAEELQARSLADEHPGKTAAAILTAGKHHPVEVGEWTSEVPLYVVATDYLPYSSIVAPTGNVVRLDPSDEYAYMESLFAAGWLTDAQN